MLVGCWHEAHVIPTVMLCRIDHCLMGVTCPHLVLALRKCIAAAQLFIFIPLQLLFGVDRALSILSFHPLKDSYIIAPLGALAEVPTCFGFASWDSGCRTFVWERCTGKQLCNVCS